MKPKKFNIGDRVRVIASWTGDKFKAWPGAHATIISQDNPLDEDNPIYTLKFDTGVPKMTNALQTHTPQRWSYQYLTLAPNPLKEVFDFLDRLE